MLANYSFPFISSEAFITEAQTDKVVTLAHDWVPDQDPFWSADVKKYLNEWRGNMSVALAPSMSLKSKNGVFNPACFIRMSMSFHCTELVPHNVISSHRISPNPTASYCIKIAFFRFFLTRYYFYALESQDQWEVLPRQLHGLVYW